MSDTSLPPEDDAVLHDHERRMKRLEEMKRNLEESLLVSNRITNNLERDVQNMDALLNAHTQWLLDNETAMIQHRVMVAQHDLRMAELDLKLDRIADLIFKGKGGNGNS
jgi:hypothetical protein